MSEQEKLAKSLSSGITVLSRVWSGVVVLAALMLLLIIVLFVGDAAGLF